MAASFDPSDLVSLPRLTATKASTLAQALLSTAAEDKKLPAAVEKARAALEEARAALEKELAAAVAPGGDTQRARDADHVEDAAWSALHDWLQGWSKLPAKRPESKTAQAILATLFPGGLDFTRVAFTAEWSEVETRIGLMKTGKLDAEIRALGGEAFLETVDEAHKEYGAALGVRGGVSEPPKRAQLGPALAALLKAVRVYAAKVMNLVESDDPKSASRVAKLLAALTKAREDAPASPQKGKKKSKSDGSAPDSAPKPPAGKPA